MVDRRQTQEPHDTTTAVLRKMPTPKGSSIETIRQLQQENAQLERENKELRDCVALLLNRGVKHG